MEDDRTFQPEDMKFIIVLFLIVAQGAITAWFDAKAAVLMFTAATVTLATLWIIDIKHSLTRNMISAHMLYHMIRESPGITDYELHRELLFRSKLAQYLGVNNVITRSFGPHRGTTLMMLVALERKDWITSSWGPYNNGSRSRVYFPVVKQVMDAANENGRSHTSS